MIRIVGIIGIFVTALGPAVVAGDELATLNRKLGGRVDDYTNNHGRDNRNYSEILCACRDMYVYLPPCYDPSKSYPLVLWLHGAFGDESGFIEGKNLIKLDRQIQAGCIKPMIIAVPDGTYGGTSRLTELHSFFINGRGGRYEEHLMLEIIPFLNEHYSIRPEREAHAIGGPSAGGYGAMVVAMKHRDYFSAVGVLAAPVNLRYDTCRKKCLENFTPESYRWRVDYRPNEVVACFYLVVKLHAWRMVEHAFGPREMVMENVMATNPADLLFSLDMQPGELDIYLNYPQYDNFNFDAHAESFHWLASQKGIAVDLKVDRHAHHNVPYFNRNDIEVYRWFSQRLLPPTETVANHIDRPAE